MADFYMVKESFLGPLGEYQKGQVVAADDPALRKNPHLFEGLRLRTGDGIEQATAAPGQKRTLTSRISKSRGKAAKSAPKPEPEPEPVPAGHALTSDDFRPKPRA